MPACPTFLSYLFKPDFENRKYSVIMSFNFMAAAPHFYITECQIYVSTLCVDHKSWQIKSFFFWPELFHVIHFIILPGCNETCGPENKTLFMSISEFLLGVCSIDPNIMSLSCILPNNNLTTYNKTTRVSYHGYIYNLQSSGYNKDGK